MNGRVFLLIAVTGLFIRIWNERDRGHDLPAATTRRTSVTQALPTVSVSEEVWTSATCPIQLPEHLGAGIYRVVNDLGQVASLEIGADHVIPHANVAHDAQQHVFVQTASDRTWYFIRLRHPALPQKVASIPEETPSLATRPQFANRKFDFTGYVP